MLKVSHAFRRTNTEAWIAASPWTVTVYRKGRTPDDPATSFDVIGRISPVGMRGTPLSLPGGANTTGEAETARYASVLVTAWDETEIKKGDLVHAVHDETGVDVDYIASFVRKTPHKYEIILDEVQ